MTKANHLLVYNGGVPTDAEVNLLLEKFGVPQAGQEIPYFQVEQVLGIKQKENRWQSVTGAWRLRLKRNHNILIKCINKSFRAMTPDERVTEGTRKIKSGVKQVGRGSEVISTTPRELMSPEMRKVADHAIRVHTAMHGAYLTEARKLEIPETEVKRVTER